MNKKKILNRLAEIADQLDDCKYHKESNIITALMFKVAHDDYLPEGALNDSRAPWNDESNHLYDKVVEEVDSKIDKEFIPLVHHFSQYKNLESFIKQTQNIFGEQFGLDIAKEIIRMLSESYTNNIHQLVYEALEPFLEDFYDAKMQEYSNYEPEY